MCEWATAGACVLNGCHLTLYRMEPQHYIWLVKVVTVKLLRHCWRLRLMSIWQLMWVALEMVQVRTCLHCCACNNLQKGFTALHIACQRGHLKVAETLIIAHASVNAQTKVSVHCNKSVQLCLLIVNVTDVSLPHSAQHDSSNVSCLEGTWLHCWTAPLQGGWPQPQGQCESPDQWVVLWWVLFISIQTGTTAYYLAYVNGHRQVSQQLHIS